MRKAVILAALLLGAGGAGRADYIVLIANVGQSGGAAPGAPGVDGMPPAVQIVDPVPVDGGVPAVGTTPGSTEIKPRLVHTIVEFNGSSLNRSQVLRFVQGGLLTVRHRWGSTQVLGANALSQVAGISSVASLHIGSDSKLLPALSKRYQDRFTAMFKGSEKPAPDVVLELADWALAHGLVDQYVEVMQKLGEEHKAHPAFVAFEKVHQALAAAKPSAAASGWEGRLKETFRLETSEHYALYHNHPRNDVAEVRGYLNSLENTFKVYYYWFARRGLPLSVPAEKLMVVLTYRDVEFTELRDLFSGSEPRADGFFVRRQQLVVLSGRRLDPSYEMLDRATATLWQKPEIGNREDLLGTRRPVRDLQDQQARSLALMLKSLESRGIQASCSHNGARQLLFASGLLPGNVHVPEWIQVGMGSLLETAATSPWATPGAPNPFHLPRFKELREKGQLGLPAETLRKVVTDSYFREAAAALDPGEAGKLREKARAASWALTYFLALRSFDELNRYFQEISKMPRDLALDEEALFGAFARAVDAWDGATGTINKRKLDYIATRWYDEMSRTNLEGAELFRSVDSALTNVEKLIKKGVTSPTNPLDPAGAGAVPGAP